MAAVFELLAELVLPCLLGLWHRPDTPGKRALRAAGVGALAVALVALGFAFLARSPALVLIGLSCLAAACLAGPGCSSWGRAENTKAETSGPAA